MVFKKFTRLQLFSIIDGRLSTSMDDVCEILNHIFQDNFSTVELPAAYDKLKEINPDWYQKEVNQLYFIRARCQSNTFETIIGAIKDKYNEEINFPSLF